MEKFYVKRTSKQNPAGYSFVGPLPASRAKREAEAWESAGETAEILTATPQLKQSVQQWEKITRAEDAREIVTYRGEQMTFARYRLEFESAA